MTDKHRQGQITVAYPPLKGSILKAYNLRQLLTASFGRTVELLERPGDQVSVSLNGKTIFSQLIDENLSIDTEGIIKAICACNIALQKAPECEAEDELSDDPEHHRWLNSVCSGE